MRQLQLLYHNKQEEEQEEQEDNESVASSGSESSSSASASSSSSSSGSGGSSKSGSKSSSSSSSSGEEDNSESASASAASTNDEDDDDDDDDEAGADEKTAETTKTDGDDDEDEENDASSSKSGDEDGDDSSTGDGSTSKSSAASSGSSSSGGDDDDGEEEGEEEEEEEGDGGSDEESEPADDSDETDQEKATTSSGNDDDEDGDEEEEEDESSQGDEGDSGDEGEEEEEDGASSGSGEEEEEEEENDDDDENDDNDEVPLETSNEIELEDTDNNQVPDNVESVSLSDSENDEGNDEDEELVEEEVIEEEITTDTPPAAQKSMLGDDECEEEVVEEEEEIVLEESESVKKADENSALKVDEVVDEEIIEEVEEVLVADAKVDESQDEEIVVEEEVIESKAVGECEDEEMVIEEIVESTSDEKDENQVEATSIKEEEEEILVEESVLVVESVLVEAERVELKSESIREEEAAVEKSGPQEVEEEVVDAQSRVALRSTDSGDWMEQTVGSDSFMDETLEEEIVVDEAKNEANEKLADDSPSVGKVDIAETEPIKQTDDELGESKRLVDQLPDDADDDGPEPIYASPKYVAPTFVPLRSSDSKQRGIVASDLPPVPLSPEPTQQISSSPLTSPKTPLQSPLPPSEQQDSFVPSPRKSFSPMQQPSPFRSPRKLGEHFGSRSPRIKDITLTTAAKSIDDSVITIDPFLRKVDAEIAEEIATSSSKPSAEVTSESTPEIENLPAESNTTAQSARLNTIAEPADSITTAEPVESIATPEPATSITTAEPVVADNNAIPQKMQPDTSNSISDKEPVVTSETIPAAKKEEPVVRSLEVGMGESSKGLMSSEKEESVGSKGDDLPSKPRGLFSMFRRDRSRSTSLGRDTSKAQLMPSSLLLSTIPSKKNVAGEVDDDDDEVSIDLGRSVSTLAGPNNSTRSSSNLASQDLSSSYAGQESISSITQKKKGMFGFMRGGKPSTRNLLPAPHNSDITDKTAPPKQNSILHMLSEPVTQASAYSPQPSIKSTIQPTDVGAAKSPLPARAKEATTAPQTPNKGVTALPVSLPFAAPLTPQQPTIQPAAVRVTPKQPTIAASISEQPPKPAVGPSGPAVVSLDAVDEKKGIKPTETNITVVALRIPKKKQQVRLAQNPRYSNKKAKVMAKLTEKLKNAGDDQVARDVQTRPQNYSKPVSAQSTSRIPPRMNGPDNVRMKDTRVRGETVQINYSVPPNNRRRPPTQDLGRTSQQAKARRPVRQEVDLPTILRRQLAERNKPSPPAAAGDPPGTTISDLAVSMKQRTEPVKTGRTAKPKEKKQAAVQNVDNSHPPIEAPLETRPAKKVTQSETRQAKVNAAKKDVVNDKKRNVTKDVDKTAQTREIAGLHAEKPVRKSAKETMKETAKTHVEESSIRESVIETDDEVVEDVEEEVLDDDDEETHELEEVCSDDGSTEYVNESVQEIIAGDIHQELVSEDDDEEIIEIEEGSAENGSNSTESADEEDEQQLTADTEHQHDEHRDEELTVEEEYEEVYEEDGVDANDDDEEVVELEEEVEFIDNGEVEYELSEGEEWNPYAVEDDTQDGFDVELCNTGWQSFGGCEQSSVTMSEGDFDDEIYLPGTYHPVESFVEETVETEKLELIEETNNEDEEEKSALGSSQTGKDVFFDPEAPQLPPQVTPAVLAQSVPLENDDGQSKPKCSIDEGSDDRHSKSQSSIDEENGDEHANPESRIDEELAAQEADTRSNSVDQEEMPMLKKKEASERKQKGGCISRKCQIIIAVIFIVLGIFAGIAIGVMVATAPNDDKNSSTAVITTSAPSPSGSVPTLQPSTSSATMAPTMQTNSPSTAPTSLPADYILICSYLEKCESLLDGETPQGKAFQWLEENNRLEFFSDEKKVTRYALATIYYSTGGDSWTDKTNWVTNIDECLWFTSAASACSDDKVLTALELDANGLNGELPFEVSLLTSLTSLSIRNPPDAAPSLTGSLPSLFGSLTNLRSVVLSGNHFSGSIPSEIGLLGAVEQLDLSYNKFVGNIPISFAGLSLLTSLNLAENDLTGDIPTNMFSTVLDLVEIILDGNAFTSLPASIKNLAKLDTLNVKGNNLVGFPIDVTYVKNLTALDLSENRLGGTIPTLIGNLLSLRKLFLSGNELTGGIPTEMGNLTQLRRTLDLSNNTLTGTIPTELGYLVGLRQLFLNNNKLSGGFPAQLAALNTIETIRVDGNDLTGMMPTAICDLYNTLRPVSYADCMEVITSCFVYCCRDGEGCTCRYETTDPLLCLG